MNPKTSTLKTLRVRVKDKHQKVLNRMAFECNQVFNAANEITDMCSWVAVPGAGYVRTPVSAFDLQKELKGIRKDRGMIIGSSTFQEVIAVHAKSRKQFKTNKLRWRSSGGARRSLGWVPFKIGTAKWVNGRVKFRKLFFDVWDSYGLSKYDFRSGSFSQDVRGRWYFNVLVETPIEQSKGTGKVGIDLGLKTTATCSDGTTLERGNHYRNLEQKLGIAQRANNKKRVKAIHAKIKNRRSDKNHKFTTKLVKENSLIVIGTVSSSGLAKTKMAKSVLDAGWSQMKRQLDYKSIGMRVAYLEVNESYTTQACSSCGEISASSPKGRAGLEIREWQCVGCGAQHDRDINAAKNILALGHERLAVGIPAL